MSTAKPQQSTGQSDGSDDLIAELARMMASDAQPEKPAANQAAPAPEPQASSPAPTVAPAVRIPGPPENAQAGEKFDFDFGAPPKPAEALAPAPLVSWQDRFNKPAERPAEPARQEPVMARVEEPPVIAEQPATPVETEKPQTAQVPSFIAPARPVAETARVEPRPEPQPDVTPEPSRAAEPPRAPEPPRPVEPVRMPEPTRSEPAASEPVAFTSHDFDFGFGTAKLSEPVTNEPVIEVPPSAPESHDAIADLIAAELSDPEPVVESHPAGDEGTSTPQSTAAPAEPEQPAPKPFLRAVNFAAQPKPASDRFAVPPVFGVGSNARPAAPAEAPTPAAAAPVEPKPAPVETPKAPLDPMDEIESLIGSSIQNDMGNKIEPRGPASAIPVSRGPSPLPRATARPIHDDHAAEAAILAAAAASGADIGRVEPARAAEERVKPEPARAAAKPPRAASRNSSFRPFVGPAIAAVLLVVAGGALYWVLGNNQGTDGAAPVLTADTSPVKEPPPAATASSDTPPASVVLNELGGGNATPEPEQLVSRDQASDTASVAAITPTETTGEEGLANRKVRTVTVRPDGTIVNADDALAGGQQLPVARPNVPEVPASNLDNSDLLAAAATQPSTTPSALTPTPATTTDGAATTPAEQTTATPIDPANVTPPDVVAPVPRPRLANRPTVALGAQPTNAVNALANDPIGALAAQATQAQTPAPAATQTASTSPQAAAYVQLSSQRDENVARQSLIEINQRYGKILGGVLPEVQRVDLGAKGIYYRVRVPADSMQSANYLCDQIKSARGDCFVTN